MGLLEPITHKDEIEQLISDAQNKYDTATERFEAQKKETTNKLEDLGKEKIHAWSTCMDTFIEAFSSFKNVSVDKKMEENLRFIGSGDEPKQIIINIQNASLTAGEVAKAGFAAIGTGALVGIASYGGVMMFGAASTGTAITNLSGAAKQNATLAWFGGGSKKIGGRGIVGGEFMLAGIIVAPILVLGTIFARNKGKERLAEAKKIYEEAEDAVSKMNIMTTGMSGIAAMSDNYRIFIKRYRQRFAPFVNAVRSLKKTHDIGTDGKIDFNSLSNAEQKTLHLSWLMAQIFYQVLSTPLLTDKGELNSESNALLSNASDEFKGIENLSKKMDGDDIPAANLMWATHAKRMLMVNLTLVAILIILGGMIITSNIIQGILFLLDSFVAFPIFVKFRHLAARRLYIWRIVRLVASFVFAILIAIFL